MNPIKKFKNRRGTALVEVLLVVALMMVMLGIAMPNLISESHAVKLSAMNGYARSVAVAVQSKLYGMKNKGTALTSEFAMLNQTSGKTYVLTSDGGSDVRYFANFGKTKATGTKILSGAIIEGDLLKNGKIVVAYDPNTADILEVFYAEHEFLDNEESEVDETGFILPNSHLFPMADEDYLDKNLIGSYFGDPKPELSRKDGLPPFTAVWRYDDELYLELQMVQGFSAEKGDLWSKPLGIEVYAEIPNETNSRKMEDVLIYAEGIFSSECSVKYQKGESSVSLNIKPDYNNALTLQKIAGNGVEEGGKKKTGVLRFAFDSLITTRTHWGSMAPNLRHQDYPEKITMADSTLYPRETIADWFNAAANPYLSFWKMREGDSLNQSIYKRIKDGASATQFIDVDETFRLHVKMYVLDEEETETITDSENSSATACVYTRDENYGVLDLRSPNITPYFYALSTARNKVTLSSIRDLNNLHYVFETVNSIDTAALAGDISAQLLYDKMTKVHDTLVERYEVENWGYGVDWDSTSVEMNYFQNKKSFTFTGKKPKGGSYKISSVTFSGRAPTPGGLFAYAENCTFQNLDIVNARVSRNGYSRGLLGSDVDNLRPYVCWGNVASGALASVAVNCKFENVRTYSDPDQAMMTLIDGTKKQSRSLFQLYRISGNIVGGLVGVAVGGTEVQTWNGTQWVSDGTSGSASSTTFTNCVASEIAGPEYYYTPGECFIAGGLVGVTVGDVQIKNSYASSQLTGYYAGGLVGAVGSVGSTESNPSVNAPPHDWAYNMYPPTKCGVATGKLKIENSFAAGMIQHTVRVGAGLIAHISEGAVDVKKGTGLDEKPVDVSNCYSAMRWNILPPVAYGTFEGDDSNYYLYPTQFDLPVTSNVVARFSCKKETGGTVSYTGNVISLQSDVKCGIACSSKMLNQKLLAKTETEEGPKTVTETEPQPAWVEKAKNTTPWHFLDNSNVTEEEKKISYPFPMPQGNTDFWGDWIRSYDETTEETNIPKSGTLTFEGYYVAYYDQTGLYTKCVDTGVVTTNNQKIELSDGKITIGGNELDTDGATLTDKAGNKSYYWAKDALKDGKIYYGEDVYGATKITDGGNGSIKFESATYYKSDYDPLAGSDFFPGIADNNVTRLMWDFYGFYLLEDFEQGESDQKYYITFGEEGKTVTTYVAAEKSEIFNKDTMYRYANVTVDMTEFKNAVGYETLTLPTTGVTIIWDEESGLHVKADGENG